ncbi:MAG: RNA helicase [Zetaproteobacteria bacterium CG06_land_8_20_14_3_00_59_53]|nr:MAG: RNA helicase [Zetaproteobacteria bacterium CG2_30_59_37]PIO88814.1 MAG: RNA helicase [Zetaproteobacteria bacterium CG23_combo_of_CG06-09_8_20_14_all_59_86]PIQ64536.1 MAG: RNA helicase [Zetaproteobacteria bacterium CG11_big_fil_rev_8_21_14_0_20_59_439]PIU70045.1 MAG: RNA helicase [Zetaproteobacteria bacterium CG06_land_8_20_14_3_00_59_53]PIU98002.1 MAG: RNA helicase [Zetaproteobacteria bacterium CG03_land_8_20_14_0_80_59_51]PIY47018.1 MAG: RNA helicase [Zetaproteobacteria bacterium CG_4
MHFKELNLPAPLQQAIDDLGFTTLTDVQEIALPMTLAGKDVAGQGRTGTGKTATFLITAINRLLTSPPKPGRKASTPRALIIAPTRELVVQISDDARNLVKHTDLKLHTVFGGVDYEKQMNAFENGVDILVGTPGRLIDYLKKKAYSLSHTEMLVIDEADRMFDLGFIKDLRFMLHRLPRYDERQSLMFSATLSHRVLELAYEHMNSPEKLRAEEGNITASGIVESMYHTGMDEKFPLLIHLLRQGRVERGVIFINEKRTGEKVARNLARYGFAIGILSGDVRQQKRMRILEDFTSGKLHLLVATDVASRGLHIDGVTHVFNYDLPEDAENYVHRIGRTARAGATGVAISFSCERYCFGLPDIEAYISRAIPVHAIEQEMLEIGKPTNPEATAEGLKSEDRAEQTGDKGKSGARRSGGGSGRPRRGSSRGRAKT